VSCLLSTKRKKEDKQTTIMNLSNKKRFLKFSVAKSLDTCSLMNETQIILPSRSCLLSKDDMSFKPFHLFGALKERKP
jgi:hypothetical protein